MNRRGLLQMLGVGAVGAVVAKNAPASPAPVSPPSPDTKDQVYYGTCELVCCTVSYAPREVLYSPRLRLK